MNRYFVFSLIAIAATVAIVFSACKKINDYTDVGGGLIPPVDNITTFDTTISIQAFNDTFGLANDSTRLTPTDEFFLGKINNDPFFGKTDARIFLELKPGGFPYIFPNDPDSLFIDSVVLVLDYLETYGDTLVPQTINVFEIDPANPVNKNFRADSTYLIRQNNFTTSLLLGSRTFAPVALKDSVKAFGGDTTAYQLRIKLFNFFGQRLLSYDTTSNISTGGYANDSVFRSKFRGFALQSMNTGNAIMGFNLAGPNTKLAIYYKYFKNNEPTNTDTTVSYFNFGQLCAAANYITRDYTGTPALATLNNPPASPDPIVYLQKTPGMFATIKIPDLALVNNRVIHRAELVMEQIYDISDSMFRSPDFMYLDAIDPTITTTQKFRTIPYDFTFGSGGTFNVGSFGIAPVIGMDAFGNRIRTWRFNISRYVQHVLTRTVPLYDLRLFPAFRFREQFGIPPGTDQLIDVFINPAAAKGRIRLGGGNHPTQKMKLRLIYSKL